jgi:hypothetical protein
MHDTGTYVAIYSPVLVLIIATLVFHCMTLRDGEFDFDKRPRVWEGLRCILCLLLLIFQIVTSVTSSGSCDEIKGTSYYNILRKHLPFASDLLSGVECAASYTALVRCYKMKPHKPLEKERAAALTSLILSIGSIICSLASLGECPTLSHPWISWI